ncbi:hypothetical protein D3C84_637690 [compost metagenome]
MLVLVRSDDKSLGLHQVFIRVHQRRADGQDGLLDFVEQGCVDAADIKKTPEQAIQSRPGGELSLLRQIVQAVEGVIARHIDGLHNHARLLRVVGSDVFHAACFDVQYPVGFMAGDVLITHF